MDMRDSKGRFLKGNGDGVRFSADNQPSGHAKSLGKAVARSRRYAIRDLVELNSERLDIIRAVMMSRETSPVVIQEVVDRLCIPASQVTTYHGIILRAAIEAQNGNVVATSVLAKEAAALCDFITSHSDDGDESRPVIQVNLCGAPTSDDTDDTDDTDTPTNDDD